MNDKLAKTSSSPVVLKTPEAWQISEALRNIVEHIGNNGAILETPDLPTWWAKAESGLDTGDTGWWEAFSHGLVSPLEGDYHFSRREQDKGFYDRFNDLAQEKGVAAAYLELEQDFLRGDFYGFERKYAEHYPKPLIVNSMPVAQSSAMRILAFTRLREELKRQGFELPENPVLAEAIEAVKAANDKSAKPAFGILPRTLTEHAKKESEPDDLPPR